MNAIRIFSGQPWVERLGWTLMHFLWQGLAIAALYSGASATAKHFSPHGRYLLACLALAAILAAPIATYSVLGSPQWDAGMSPYAATVSPSSSGTTFVVTAGGNASTGSTFAAVWPERVLPPVVMLWLAGALGFWARLVGGWMTAARLCTRRAHTPPSEWQQALDCLAARLRVGQRVQLLVSELVETPAVVGWLRPVVLVPIGAFAGLPAEHLEALLLHELAHVRRHDYLVNMLQSIAEALLFYHPAVWWISRQIRAERELCCDDLAVAATGDALTYATALADLEACRQAHPRTALAANGGGLADRIARILGKTRPETRTFSAPGAAGAALLAITTCFVFGQTADRPAFEVASVKPTPEKVLTYSSLRTLPGGHLDVKNVTVSGLIMTAYHLQQFQIAGGPAWIHDVGFDIEARGNVNANRAQMITMIQPLLEDRFQLKFHRETRELPAYALTVTRGGLKLLAPKQGGCAEPDGPKPPGPPPAGGTLPIPCGILNILTVPSGMRLRGGDVPMSELTRMLSMVLNRPVLDRTGLTRHFDVDLTFAVDDLSAGLTMVSGSVAGHREAMAAAAAANDSNAVPNILTAVQAQLGLKLDPGKGPSEVMIIDRVEMPTAN
jgi:uncharacterized protein (TIGR03435 family)